MRASAVPRPAALAARPRGFPQGLLPCKRSPLAVCNVLLDRKAAGKGDAPNAPNATGLGTPPFVVPAGLLASATQLASQVVRFRLWPSSQDDEESARVEQVRDETK